MTTKLKLYMKAVKLDRGIFGILGNHPAQVDSKVVPFKDWNDVVIPEGETDWTMTRIALYARVSTTDKEQNPDMQIQAMRKYCASMEDWNVTQEYIDFASSVDFRKRKLWQEMMKHASLKKFDIVLVWRLDRAFRDVLHGANTLGLLKTYGVGFRSQMDPYIDTTTPYGEALYHILNAFSQLERATIRQNVKQGMAHAKAYGTKSGKPIGRKPANIGFAIICEALHDGINKDGKVNYSEAARILKKMTGKNLSPGFIHTRITREAEKIGAPREDLLNEILVNGKRKSTGSSLRGKTGAMRASVVGSNPTPRPKKE